MYTLLDAYTHKCWNLISGQFFWQSCYEKLGLMYAPLGIHLETINISDKIIIINCATEGTVYCQIRSSLGQWCAI